MQKMKVKIVHNKEIRVWKYPSNHKYSSLLSFINKTFNLSNPLLYTLQYCDDEGDNINIITGNDINDALLCAKQESRKSLKIFLISSLAMDNFLNDALFDMFNTKSNPSIASNKSHTISPKDIVNILPKNNNRNNNIIPMDPADILASMFEEEQIKNNANQSNGIHIKNNNKNGMDVDHILQSMVMDMNELIPQNNNNNNNSIDNKNINNNSERNINKLPQNNNNNKFNDKKIDNIDENINDNETVNALELFEDLEVPNHKIGSECDSGQSGQDISIEIEPNEKELEEIRKSLANPMSFHDINMGSIMADAKRENLLSDDDIINDNNDGISDNNHTIDDHTNDNTNDENQYTNDSKSDHENISDNISENDNDNCNDKSSENMNENKGNMNENIDINDYNDNAIDKLYAELDEIDMDFEINRIKSIGNNNENDNKICVNEEEEIGEKNIPLSPISNDNNINNAEENNIISDEIIIGIDPSNFNSEMLLSFCTMGNSNSTEQNVDRTDESISNSTTNHLISIQELKIADHIYHQYNTMWRQRHGIVTYIPLERTHDQIRVATIIIHDDYNDIAEISLSKFLDGRKLRQVKYHVSAWYESLHVKGCCHRQIKSKPPTIIERCKAIKEEFEIINNDWSNDSLYLQQLTDAHFSFWCSTGITHILITKERIGTMLEEIEDKRLGIYDHHTSIVEVQLNDHDEKNGTELASVIAKVTTDLGKTVVKEVGKTVAKEGGKTAAKKIANKISTKILETAAKKAVKLGTEIQETALTKFASKVANLTESVSAVSATTKEVVTEGAKKGVSSVAVAGLVCVSVGLELAATGYRVHKYRNDVDVLWVDTKLALIQGWTTTGCTVGAGLVCLVTGVAAWPAAFITCGVGLFCWIGFKIYKYYNGKRSKEKLFKERGLKLNASIREKQAEIRLINKEINKERLHPDKFRFDLPQKYVKIYELKRHPLDITIKVGETGTYAVIDNAKMSQWRKGVRSGMVVYSINNCVVYNNDTFDVDEIKEMFDENTSDSSDTIQIGLFKMKKVAKEIERRTKKYHWLEDLKELIKEDIHECRANKKGIKKSRKRNKKQSAPLAITWDQ